MLNSNKLKIIFAFISLLLCITTVQQTYAKYVSSAEAETSMTVARWRILVNNQDIHNGTVLNEIITPTFDGTDYIADDVVAPTSQGYFDIVLDSTNTDLSFSYAITTTVDSNSSVSDLVVTGYSINGGTTTAIGQDHTVSGNILYSSGIKSNTIRIYIEWDDSQTANMDNTEDTDASYSTSSPLMDINLSFVQLTN